MIRKRTGKRKDWNRYGVSEIIGTLLILAITVALFSGILWYVSSMPTPTQNVYSNFYGSVDYQTGSYCDITIKHLGGESLSNSTTNIYLITDTDHLTLKISDSSPSVGTSWSMGTTWHYHTTTDAALLALTNTSNLEVMIVDTEKNVIVWNGVLLGNGGSSSIPVVCDRYLAQEVNASAGIWMKATSFTSPQHVALFVNVLDNGNDLAHIYADVSALGGPSSLELIDTNSDGWYSMDFLINSDVGVKYISISATDNGGRVGTSTLAVLVTTSDKGSEDNPHGNGSAPGNLHFSNLQGINLFKYNDWMAYNYGAEPTDTFSKSDNRAVVIMASKFLVNTENDNEMLILDNNGQIVRSVSSSEAFMSYDYYSGYYVYQAFIELSKLTDGAQYYVQVSLRDSYLPNNNQFFAVLPFTVGTSTQPRMETYSDAAYTRQCTTFNTTDTIYVKIFNAPSGTWNQNAGLVEVTDYSWDMQIKRIPGSDGSVLQNPVSTLTKSGSTYDFSINLSAANQSPWLPGNNSYMLRYDLFTVEGQSFLLSKMIDIASPKIILDLVAADNSASLQGGWSEGTMIDYYSNDNQWVPADMIQNWDDKHNAQYEQAVFVRLADIQSNGKLDVVAVLIDSSGNYVINIYRNDGAWTPIHVDSEGRGTITAITVGALDTSAGDDIIVGYSNGEVGFYRNDGTWTYQLIDSTVRNCAVTSLVAIDVLNTEATYGTPRSMYVVSGYSSSVSVSYPIHIWVNWDRMGSTWHDIPYKGQLSNIESAVATRETAINSYIVNGSYVSANLGGGGYEEISEMSTAATFSAHSTVSSVDSSGRTFAVTSGATIGNNLWNSWSTTPTSNITSVRLEVSYVTSKSVNADSYITWTIPSSGATGSKLLGSATSGSPTVVSSNIIGVNNLDDLFNLGVKFTNNANNAVYTFSYWRLYVTFEAEGASMAHSWTIPTGSGGTNSLEFVSKVSSGLESFTFQYSTDNGANYNTFSPSQAVTSTSYVKYSFALPTTAVGTTFIIKVTDSNPTSAYMTNTTLSIKNLCINTTTMTAGSLTIGLPVTDLEVYDMDNDGVDDLIIADGQNVWICYNEGGSLTSQLPTQVTSPTIPNIISIAVGKITSQSDYPGVVVLARSSGVYKVYTIEPGADGKFDSSPAIERVSSTVQILKLVGGDIDNDGDVDFVVSTASNTIVYYRNDGSGKFNSWTIDTLPMGVNDIALGKIQNN